MGKIIVLEDNTLFSEIVCRWLQREGWKSETVTNISRAKKLMEKADTDDIVLADLRFCYEIGFGGLYSQETIGR